MGTHARQRSRFLYRYGRPPGKLAERVFLKSSCWWDTLVDRRRERRNSYESSGGHSRLRRHPAATTEEKRLDTTQRRATSDTRVLSVVRRDQWNVRVSRVHAPILHARLNLAEIRLQHHCHSAAQNHHVGLQEVDDIPQPDRQILNRLGQNLP